MKSFICYVFILGFTLIGINLSAQDKIILVDVGHGEKFYSDPSEGISSELVPSDRLKYLTSELTKNATAHKAKLAYQKKPFTKDALLHCNMIFIHVPSLKYSTEECKVIREYLEKGGSLFVVIEEDYWATLEQININDIVKSFGITFGLNNPDQSVGGHSNAGKVTSKNYSIPFHGARIIEGGTPFACSNQQPDTKPFGVFTETKGGGRIIAMGEGMVSLYMTEWQGVKDYQCAPFMNEVIGWLLK